MPESKETAKAERAQMYAQWLADDADGLLHNIDGLGLNREDEYLLLKNMRQHIAGAFQKIEGLISENRSTRSVSA